MKTYHRRFVEERLGRLARMFPIVVVVGARQVGKSTLLQQFLGPEVRRFVFDPLDDMYGARSDPDLFLDQYPPPIFLDDIQYAVELLPALKRRVDLTPERKGSYYLCGSQNLAVLRDVSESMAGRAGILELDAMSLLEWEVASPPPEREPWLARWFSDPGGLAASSVARPVPAVPVSHRLWRGMLPGLLESESLQDVPDYLRSYVMTYLERDVRRAGDVQALETFRRFMSLVAALTAGEINVSQLGRDIGIARTTARKWLSLLSATYQWLSIPPYHGNTIKRISGHHKGYLQDAGLACFLQRISSPDALMVSPFIGAAFETFAATEICKQIAAMPTQPACYHWRTHAGAEVDLVLEMDGRLWPFEFKAGTRITKHDASGIRAFRKTYPGLTETPGAIVAPVAAPRLLTEDVWVLPYDLGLMAHG